jgi:hypothetical protein
MDRVLEVARLTELAMSRTETTTSESMVCQQLVEMQAKMRRLSIKVDKAMTTTITPRSPTPERRVHFIRDESPAPRATSPKTRVGKFLLVRGKNRFFPWKKPSWQK